MGIAESDAAPLPTVHQMRTESMYDFQEPLMDLARSRVKGTWVRDVMQCSHL